MEIIVTDMPELPCQCPLSKQNRDGEWICSKYDYECNIDMCDLLKPITDYVFEERIAENITKRTPLKDINSNR